MISTPHPTRETAPIVPLQAQPRCAQCDDPLPVERASARVKGTLCADCALDGMPHTD